MKALVLCSGGIDSATCLALALERYGKEEVLSCSVFYGQKHVKELEASKKIADAYGVKQITLDLSNVFEKSDCTLLAHTKAEIPKQSYAVQLKEQQGKPVSTYVPFRNGLFLSAAASLALSYQCEVVYYGAHRDDAAGSAYPDCSEGFYEAMRRAVEEGSGKQLTIEAPLLHLTKAEVVAMGLIRKVPYALTWSCYEGAEKPCGVCGTCRDRAQAFAQNGVEDPALQLSEKR